MKDLSLLTWKEIKEIDKSKSIVVIASHADPQHQIAVEKAVRKINRKHGICSFAPMGEYGHLGAPRLSSKELGDMLNENCIASIADAVIKFYKRDGYELYGSYTLYKIFPLHIGFLPVLGRVNRKKVTE